MKRSLTLIFVLALLLALGVLAGKALSFLLVSEEVAGEIAPAELGSATQKIPLGIEGAPKVKAVQPTQPKVAPVKPLEPLSPSQAVSPADRAEIPITQGHIEQFFPNAKVTPVDPRSIAAALPNGNDAKVELFADHDGGLAFASNKADAAVKAGAEKTDATAIADADRTEAMVKPAIPSSPDQPDKLDGDELAKSCKAEVQGFDAGYCLGVVEGVMASMRACKHDHSVITLGEAADAVEKYLSNHPEKLNERDVVVARKALSKAYPCGGFRQ